MGDTNEDLLDDGDFLEDLDIDGDQEDALLADDTDTTAVKLQSRLSSRAPELKKLRCNPDDEEDTIELGVPEYDLSLAEEERGDGLVSEEMLVKPVHDEGANESDDEEDSRNRSRFKAERNIVTTRRGSNSIPETLDNVIVIKAAPVIARRQMGRGRGGLKTGKIQVPHLRGPHPRPLIRHKFPCPDLQGPPMARRMIRPTIHVNPHFRPRIQKEWQDHQALYLNQGHNQQFQFTPNIPPPFNNKQWQPPNHNVTLHQRLGPPVPQWNSPPPHQPDYGRPPDQNQMNYQNNVFNDYPRPPSGPNMCFPQSHPMEPVGWSNPCYPSEVQPDHSVQFPRFNHPPPHQIPSQFSRPPPPFRPHYPPGMGGPPHNKIPRPPITPNNHHLSMPPQAPPPMTKKYPHKVINSAKVVRNLQPVNIVENTAIEEPPAVEEPEEDEEMKAYRLKIENQKKLREEILRMKEEKRAEKQRLGLNNNAEESGKSDLVQKVAELQKKAMKDLGSALGGTKGTQARKRPAPDAADGANKKAPSDSAEALDKAGPSIESHIVEVNNLSASTTKKQLLEMGKKIGSVQSLELVNGQAKISFESTSEAAEFVTKYQRKMVDLSMISVTLVPEKV